MTQNQKRMRCQACGFIAKPRAAHDTCPQCGADLTTERLLAFEAELDTAFPLIMTVRNADGPSKKVPTEVVIKNELHHDSGRWQQAHRTFDRFNDRYRETITDHATGDVVVHKDERLSDHRGRGSARGKRDPEPT